MSHDHEDAIDRVRMMASGDPSWDLSPKDCDALNRVLAMIDSLRATVHTWERVAERLGECDRRD